MIEKRLVQKLTERWQTTMDNVVREYFQQLFLSKLYQGKDSDSLLFKGGTALRIIWHSPRFSEDLDFTGVNITVKEIESLVEDALAKMELEDIRTGIVESKKTSGGYLAIFQFETDEYKSRVQTEISLRTGRKSSKTAVLVQSELVLPYTIVHLAEEELVDEKIKACLSRRKARDFYDLYFILRSRMAFKEIFIRDKSLRGRLLDVLKSSKLDFRRELKAFLPINQHIIIKDFAQNLKTEIERSLAG